MKPLTVKSFVEDKTSTLSGPGGLFLALIKAMAAHSGFEWLKTAKNKFSLK